MHILLEGDRGCGKSSLILETLGEQIAQAGGFGTVRLFDEEGLVRGYAQVRACELHEVNHKYQGQLPNVFLERTGERAVTHMSVLMDYTLPLLQEPASFYLLDEIGGAELLLPAWKERLYHMLAGKTPCIGVWKSEDNCWKLRKKNEEFAHIYQEMRAWILAQPQIQLLRVTPENREAVREEIQNWKKHWL